MSRRRYVALACTLPRDWLIECVAHPNPHMKPAHVALLRVALRRMKRSR